MTTPPELAEHPDVVNTRRALRDQLERMGPDEQDQRADLQELLELLETDPTVALFAPAQRTIALVQELARQRTPLARQVALAREHERLRADPARNARALNRLGKINPLAIEEHAALRTRTAELLQELRTLADPAWTTPSGAGPWPTNACRPWTARGDCPPWPTNCVAACAMPWPSIPPTPKPSTW